MAREQFQTLTEPMYYILIALSEECCGVDIMEKVTKKIFPAEEMKVGPGTLYTMLSKFEEKSDYFQDKRRRKKKVLCDHRTWKKIAAGRARKIMYHAGRLEWIF